ncbi:type III polyketide synthase [Alphaproteobacteria bacterium]|nr:type III polyketide synthase [Alphaproteobacteria bacterium]
MDEKGVKKSARLLGIATSVPPFKLEQADIMNRATRLLPGVDEGAFSRMMPIYENAGIETRYSCVPADWYEAPHSWEEKNRLYLEHAVDLLEQAVLSVIDESGIPLSDIDAVVAVSSTGIATPSLDALIVERLALRRNIERSPLFGLGCAGGVMGLSRAATIARADPGKTVLLLVVEICGLTFRRSDHSKANIVATALFGDGAAAMLLRCDVKGPAFEHGGEFSWPNSLDVMGWRVENDGLGVVFSQHIPTLTRNEFRDIAAKFLQSRELTFNDVDQFACHPGGAKVLDALEEAFNLPTGSLVTSRSILREYGNMSAVTVLFVLERLLKEKLAGRYLLSSLGPGFTAAFQTLIV